MENGNERMELNRVASGAAIGPYLFPLCLVGSICRFCPKVAALVSSSVLSLSHFHCDFYYLLTV